MASNRRRPLSADLNDAVNRALRRTGDQLEQRFVEELSDPKWDWPSQPSPRDIVDSGRLRASMQRESKPGVEEFSWPVEYAVQVHEGATLINGRRLPARPWTKEPMQEVEERFKQVLREEINKQQQ